MIVNNDAAGEGFNDPTPAAPVGGNPGTTLGQQRLIAFQTAANLWGARLNSPNLVPIQVLASFDPLACTATGAVLGSAGARFVSRDFTFAPLPGTWYGEALANALAGIDLVPNEPEIAARFNSNLGQSGCLTGVFFYLGLDNNHGSNVDLVTVLLHEFGHGFNFQTPTNGTTGAPRRLPLGVRTFLADQSANKLWFDMTNAERVASAVNTRRLSWTGAHVTAAVPSVLAPGTPELDVRAPGSVAGTYLEGAAASVRHRAGPFAGVLMPVTDTGGRPPTAPLTGANALAVNGKLALIDRGICGFTVKVKNAQDAGAIGVLIADNVADRRRPGSAASIRRS